MIKILLIFSAIIVLNTSNAQIAQQDFEGPILSPWDGTGSIVGSQGSSWDTHDGGGMYKLTYTSGIYVSLSLPAVTKYIGLWINETIYYGNSISVDLRDNSGNLIQNIGSHPAGSSGQWNYKQYQLGAGYSGSYRISFSRKYSNGNVQANATYLDDIIISTTTSNLKEEISENDFKIYPNPIQNKLNLVFKSNLNNLNIEIIDITGKIVYSEKDNINLLANETKEIDVSSLGSGVYFCTLSNEKNSFVKKIVIE